MAEIIRSVKGTRDFYPELMAVRRWMFEKIRKVSTEFGYQEYEGPCLEFIDLYAAKSGDELVKEQAFVFSSPGDDLLTLRPELTPTLARMVAQKQYELVYPLRWWSFGPFWRYEKPQRGRTREFYQWNIDLIGTEAPASEAEIVAVAASFFKEVGLRPDQVKIYVNNRRLMDQVFNDMEIKLDLRPTVLRLVDRIDKLSGKDWQQLGVDSGLTIEQINRLLDNITNTELWRGFKELETFFELIKDFGVEEYVEFNPKIIRGLDYYTGVVFEAFEIGGQSRAVLGGGRYDNLVGDVGGSKLSGVGFAMGDVVIELVLRDAGVIPSNLGNSPQVLVTVFDQETISESLSLATELRNAGLRVLIYPDSDKLGKQFKFADRMNIPLAIVLGPDEINNHQATIKNLFTREQVTIQRDKIVNQINQMVENRK